jgi:hypothetical protein
MEFLSLKQKLRNLIAEHSPQEVHQTLQEIFHEDFSFYKKHFSTQKVQVESPIETPEPAPAPASAPKVQKPVRITSGTRIQVHKEQPVLPETSSEEKAKTHQEEVLDEQEKKEKEKFAELVAKGVNPESLLTKENLTDWLQVKKHTFAYIARELVGLSQAQVRYAAKLYKIESPISLRRKGLVASKLKGMS